MMALNDFPSHDALKDSLMQKFTEDITWPIPASWLAALVDMGMTDELIGRYFSVTVPEVASLRRHYRLGR
jgi:hypothetical protein